MAVEVIGTLKPKNNGTFPIAEAQDILMPSGKRLNEEDFGSGAASSAVSGHNTSTEAHNDIRLLLEELGTRLNALANSTDEDLDQMAEIVAYIKANKALIDSITTSKVSVADIVNNLTTNVANKPLSAAQGVALKKLIEEQGGGADIVVDAEFSETSSNPVQNKVITAVLQEASATLAQLGGAVEALGDRVPAASVTDNGKILQVVNGQWAPADAPSGGGTDIVVDAELSGTSENPVQNKVVTAVVQEASMALTQLGGAVEQLGQRVMPEVSAEDNGKMFSVVNGQWAVVDVANSPIKAYIDDYINEALGGDY